MLWPSRSRNLAALCAGSSFALCRESVIEPAARRRCAGV